LKAQLKFAHHWQLELSRLLNQRVVGRKLRADHRQVELRRGQTARTDYHLDFQTAERFPLMMKLPGSSERRNPRALPSQKAGCSLAARVQADYQDFFFF
jgi:hypothetical protein